MGTKGGDPINPFEYDGGGIAGKIHLRGLTKREYFAIEILSGICAAGIDHDVPHNKNKSQEAVEIADSLIEELNKK